MIDSVSQDCSLSDMGESAMFVQQRSGDGFVGDVIVTVVERSI